MKLRVLLMPAAKGDLRDIVHWIKVARQSPEGASAWLNRWQRVLLQLEKSADTWGLAPEDVDHDISIRQLTFKTRRGRVYRALFTIRDHVAYVLRIRGPGQDLASADDLDLPD